jgi:hypothetical protein
MAASGEQVSKADLDEVRGVALATFAMTLNTITVMKGAGRLTQEDIDKIVGASLLALQGGDVSNAAVHAGRVFLSTVAESLGVTTAKPS